MDGDRARTLPGNPFDRPGVVIASHAFAALRADELSRVPWDVAVIDEAHRLRNAYRKDHRTGQALRRGLRRCPKLLLTATPLQNDLMELLGLAAFIDDALLGNEETFRLQYATGELSEDKAEAHEAWRDPDPKEINNRNYRAQYNGAYPKREDMVRIDANISPSLQAYYRFIKDKDEQNSPWGLWVNGNLNYDLTPTVFGQPGKGHNFHLTKMFTPTLIVDGGLTVGGISPAGVTCSAGGSPLDVRSLYPTRNPAAKNTPQTVTMPRNNITSWRAESPCSSRSAYPLSAIALLSGLASPITRPVPATHYLDVLGAGAPDTLVRFIKLANRSMGSGNTMVVFFSVPISTRVCR